MNIIPNKNYNTVNVNGAKLNGAEVMKTYETQIRRFYSKTMGVISTLYVMAVDTTYIWLSVDMETDDNSTVQRISLKGSVSDKAIKQYLKSYLLDHDIRITDDISNFSIEVDTDKSIDTVVEIVMYQGNLMITWFDGWFDIALMNIEVKLTKSLIRHKVLETFVYGGNDFGDDKLIELFGQIEYDMKTMGASYIVEPLDIA